MKKVIAVFVTAFFLSACASVDVKESGTLSHEFKKAIEQKKMDPHVTEYSAQVSASAKSKPSGLIKLKSVAMEDFIRVVFTEVFQYPYVLDRDIEFMEKKIDVEINRVSDSKKLFAVIINLLEKAGIEVENVDGVFVITPLRSISQNNSGRGFMNQDNSSQGGSRGEKVSIPAECVYSYKPVYARAGDLMKSIQGIFQNEKSKVIVSDHNNTLIVRSTDRERRVIVKLLRDLDEKQKSVAVDVTLAEVTLNDDLSFGIEGFLKTNLIEIQSGNVPNNGYGITGSILISDWLKTAVQMGERRGLIKIKSNPYLIIGDGSESSIEIGNEVPILTSQKSSGDTSILSQVDYRKTGILINLRPVISDDAVYLTSSIEMSEGQRNELTSINSPAILNRKIKSSVIVPSGHSLIIGGLISENVSNDRRYLPFVNNSLGLLSGFQKIKSRTEIVVILNVSIMKDSNDEFVKRFIAKFENHDFRQRGAL